MEITNLTPNIGELTKEGKQYYYDLGTIPQGTPVTFTLGIENQLINMTQYGCQSCTTGVIQNEEVSSKQVVTYDSSQFGEFQKPINIHLMNSEMIQLIFKGTSN